MPAPAPVIERQPYKDAPDRSSLSSGDDPNARRRIIAGVATSARGVLEPASTTKLVLAGGDQSLLPVLAAGAPSASTAPAMTDATTPSRIAQTGAGSAPTTPATSIIAASRALLGRTAKPWYG